MSPDLKTDLVGNVYFVDAEAVPSGSSTNVEGVFVNFVGEESQSERLVKQSNWWSHSCFSIERCSGCVRGLSSRVSQCCGFIGSGCGVGSICMRNVEHLARCPGNTIAEIRDWAGRNKATFACMGFGAAFAALSASFGGAYQTCVDTDTCNEPVIYTHYHTDENGDTHSSTRFTTRRQEYFETAVSTACFSVLFLGAGLYGFCGGDLDGLLRALLTNRR